MGMKYLLDTHIFLWLLTEPNRISPQLHAKLGDLSNEIYVSAVSAYEVYNKSRLGKLDTTGLPPTWDAGVDQIRATRLGLSTNHAIRAAKLEWNHRDPFDRMLVAQALEERLTLVTVDKNILALPLLGAMNAVG